MVLKAKNSLLLLTQKLNDLKPNLKYLIEESLKYTNNNLYVYINPFLNKILSESNHSNQNLLFNDRFQLKLLINQFYQYSFKINPDINVTCLLHNVHQHTKAYIEGTNTPKFVLNYDLILTDFKIDKNENNLDKFLKYNLPNSSTENLHYLSIDGLGVLNQQLENESNYTSNEKDLIYQNKVYDNSIIGGTFDRIHIGHKIMLSDSALLTRRKFLAGISDGPLLARKKLAELIEDVDVRRANVKHFLNLISPDLEVITVPITDPFGPSITESDYQCLIVSQETSSGGDLVNEKRIQNKLNKLDIHIVDLIKEDSSLIAHDNGDEEKISSSNQRRRLLGSLIREPFIPYDENKPYVIGLTGGLASGKSHIVKDLEKLGAATVDSDKLGHKAYEKGTQVFNQVVETFGSDLIDQDGCINRKKLGQKVFGNEAELKKLTDIVWPEIRRLRDIEIDELFKKGNKIIVVEAAVMLEAKWNQNVNEIWICFIPEEEAIKRALQRDGSSLDRVKNTLNSQMPNKEKLKYANVVFCSLWEREYTIKQVKKAWDLLLKRTINK